MGIAENPILRFSTFFSNKHNELSQFYPNVELRYYSYARVALYFALKEIGLPAGSSVLVPKYICNSAVVPYHLLNLEVVYYDIGRRFSVDTDLLERALLSSTRALMIVDYFGFPQPFADIRSFCESHRLILIEDNTHGFLSSYGNQMLGTFGDIGIISVRKSLPVPDGAILLSHYELPSNNDIALSAPSAFKALKFVVRNLFRNIEDALGTNILTKMRFKREESNRDLTGEEFSLDGYLVNHSKLGEILLSKVDLVKYKRTHIENFGYLSKIVSGIPTLHAVFDSPPLGIVPFCFPLHVDNLKKFHGFCRRNSIEYFTWPSYPAGILPISDYEDLIFLPIHSKFDFSILLEYEK